ncbi:prestin-like isoform X2 [Oppia nitens]|uniref:prestin-like isoform X2 n=1 Tax=Oppia nitens TaxID=1686743 RepID=UPI0023D9F40D|nr:prestin-like isoform X2 [Oppia nitens]
MVLNLGTFAIISIMSANAAEKLNAIPTGHNSTGNSADIEQYNDVDYTTLEVLTSLAFLTGIIQAAMGLVRLGALSVILSDTLVSAFSTGCAIEVATSQLSNLFDIKVPKNKVYVKWLPFKLPNKWVAICEQLVHTNLVTLGLSIFGISLLVLVKEIIEPKIKKRFKTNIPFPIDILLVIGFTLFSWLMDLHKTQSVDIMGDIPKGLPEPRIPRLDILSSLIIDSLVIAIVAFAVSLSLAKIFAKKHKYRIDANQELIALGSANIFASLFACYPSSASLSRSSVQEKTGGRTQVAGLVSSACMLIFLLFLGPLLYHLPKTTLSCIILVALKSMFLQFKDLINSWKISKLEALVWLITFLSVVLLGVDIGLIVGIGFSILTVLFRFTMPKSTINGQLAFSEIYVDTNEFSEAKQINGIKIFQFHCPLFFMNSQNFKSNLFKKTLNVSTDEMDRLIKGKSTIHTIILDFSSVFFIDSTGVETLIDCIEELDELNIRVIICQCSQFVSQMLQKMSFFTKLSDPHICATVHDSVIQNSQTLLIQ